MIISIDIDGVLVDRENYQVNKAIEFAKKNGLPFDVVDEKAYNVHNMFGWSREIFYKFWEEYLWDYATLPPIGGVKEVFKKLKADGHKLVINTSRWLSETGNPESEKMRATVKAWFEKHNLQFDELVFADGDKVSVIKKFKADIHIEDSPVEAKPIAELVPVIIFDAKYNEDFNGKNISHAKTWNDVYALIKQKNS